MSFGHIRPGTWIPGPEWEAPFSVVQALEDESGDAPCGVVWGPAQITLSKAMMERLTSEFPEWFQGEGIRSEPLWGWPAWNLEQRIALLAAVGTPRAACYVLTCVAVRLKGELPRTINWRRWGKSLLMTLASGVPYSRDPTAHQMASIIEAIDRVGQCLEESTGTHNMSLVHLKYACLHLVEANIWSESRICAWIVENFPFSMLMTPWRVQ